MLIDPIPVAASAPNPAYSWLRVRSDGYGAEYLDVGTGNKLKITHETTKAGARHYLQLVQTKDATDPYSGTTKKQVASVSVSLSIPSFGWTEAEAAALYKALVDTIADADVTINKILQNQS